MSEVLLPGLRAGSPAGALALYGIAWLLPAGSTVRWVDDGHGGWLAAVDAGTANLGALSTIVVDAIKANGLGSLSEVAKDINEVTPEQFAVGRPEVVHRVLVGLAAEAPLRANGNLAITPICTYSFATRGTLFGNAAKQDASLTVDDLQRLLAGEAREQKGCNTLGFDPAARRQDGAVIGPDPSADGVRGVPGVVPLVLRGLASVAPMPSIGRRAQGGAFVRNERRWEFRWPVFTTAVPCDALPLLVARDWGPRSAAQRAANSVGAVYASRVLRDERRLAQGRRIA